MNNKPIPRRRIGLFISACIRINRVFGSKRQGFVRLTKNLVMVLHNFKNGCDAIIFQESPYESSAHVKENVCNYNG